MQLKKMGTGLNENDIREVLSAWVRIYELSIQHPRNCEMLLEHRGILEVFLKCLNAFPDDLNLKHYSIGSLILVAEVEHLRPKLMNRKMITVFYNLLDSTDEKNYISYLAALFLIHILSDGIAAWTIKPPRRADVLSGIRRSIKRWEDQSVKYSDRTRLGLYLGLLSVSHTPECQLFAAWSLRNLTKKCSKDIIPALVKEGGLDILNNMSCEDEDVRKFVAMTLEVVNDDLPKSKTV